MKGPILIAFFLVWGIASGQKKEEIYIDQREQINIASSESVSIHIPRPSQLKSGATTKAIINVNFVNFPEQAKKVFLDAVSIWENQIYSEVPIQVQATWESMSGNILGKGMPACFYRNFDGALYPDIFYPITLVEKLSGKNVNGAEADIVCSFNSNISWYMGVDGKTPSGQYDFLTAVLHEITHGLGFSGFLDVENNQGFISSSNGIPSIYDYYILNELGQQISNPSFFSRPSSELYKQLTSDKLKIQDPAVNYLQNETKRLVYAPSTWRDGSSIYHTKESSLMSPAMFKGNAIHNPGENVMTILNEIGWKTVSFKHEKVNDMEVATTAVPVTIKINSDFEMDKSSVKLIYSTDYFTTSDSVSLNYNNISGQYTGEIPVAHSSGNIQYYFTSKTTASKEYRYPSLAPSKKLLFKIGPDYFPPVVSHNPTKIIPEALQNLTISAMAEDNMEIGTVIVEYKINGIPQEPVVLNSDSVNRFKGNIRLDENMGSLEYRILAEDNSSRKNKKYAPQAGFYQVEIFRPEEPLNGYVSDFNSATDDFIHSDFRISAQAGFTSGILHTMHPYQVSGVENEMYHQVAQLKYPIVVRENGIMSFDEVVLVEPGTQGTRYSDRLFWDYVIVEGSNDNGVTWLPLSEGYDAQQSDAWHSAFTSSIVNNLSVSNGSEDMFVRRSLNLTNNTGFRDGDVILVRFRLASDASINGWGWAIDNLEIQKLQVGNSEIERGYTVQVYPNPFSGILNIDFSSQTSSQVEVSVFNLTGKTVFSETWSDTAWDSKKQIDLSTLNSGIYLVQGVDENANQFTKKIIKN